MGDSPKWVKSRRRRKKEKKKERLNDGNNNGQATHGARKLPGPIRGTYTNYEIQKIISELRYSSFREVEYCID